ncbi:MAG: 30S ribosome-binding factor RbfA [Candidatus Ozemobacteraceae bacterium]
MTVRRQERVEALLVREISQALQRKIQDPRVRGVHIVRVDVSPDFHLARVFYSMLGDTLDPEAVQKGLDSAKTVIRCEIRKAMTMRTIPELAFKYDPSINEGDQMLGLLRRLERDRIAHGPVDSGSENTSTSESGNDDEEDDDTEDSKDTEDAEDSDTSFAEDDVVGDEKDSKVDSSDDRDTDQSDDDDPGRSRNPGKRLLS